MKKPNFCAIFATMFVAATVIMLASCSQDDEFYEEGLFTRADEMMTRAGEPGGNTPTPPTPPPFQKIAAGVDTFYYDIPLAYSIEIESIISWEEGYTSVTAHPVNPQISASFFPGPTAGSYKFEIVEQKVNWLGATGVIGYITYRAIDLHTSDTINTETIEFIETVEKVFIP